MQGPPAFHRRFQARLDAGTREFRGSDSAPDSFTSFKRSATAWDRDAGVARALDRAWGRARGDRKGHGSVQHPADRESGTRGWRARATRSDARGRARRDRCFAEVIPATAFRAWVRRSRAPSPGAAPCRSETHESFFRRSGDPHAPGGFYRIALPTARDALSGQSRRAQTA